MNLQSWILLIAVGVCFVAALVYIVKHKENGSCSGNCSVCGKRCTEEKES